MISSVINVLAQRMEQMASIAQQSRIAVPEYLGRKNQDALNAKQEMKWLMESAEFAMGRRTAAEELNAKSFRTALKEFQGKASRVARNVMLDMGIMKGDA